MFPKDKQEREEDDEYQMNLNYEVGLDEVVKVPFGNFEKVTVFEELSEEDKKQKKQ